MVTRNQEFEELLETYGRAIGWVAESYSRSSDEREDLFQEICLAIWTALPRFRGDSSKKTYIYRIAHNCALRRLARRPVIMAEYDDEQFSSNAPSPERCAEKNESREQLMAAIRSLPLALRQTLVLALDDLTHQEIASVLGVSESNVAVRLHRARTLVTTIMEKENGRIAKVA